jgi:hypothetical protein
MSTKPLLLILLAVLAPAASAQKISPGLWEHAISFKSGDGQMEAAMAKMQESMAKMSPEQRKMMEDMMSRQGVGMAGGPGKPTTLKICISKEQAERAEVAQGGEGHCKQETLQRSSSTLKFKYTCTDPVSSGEGEFSFISDKAYTGSMVMTSTRDGKPQRMEVQQSGKWLGADCGTLKPRQ